jgi:hypothetical protein
MMLDLSNFFAPHFHFQLLLTAKKILNDRFLRFLFNN